MLGAGPSTAFKAVQVLIEAGRDDEARERAKRLAERVAFEPQIHALPLEGELALHQGHPHRALDVFRWGQGRPGTWPGRFDLGRAYLEVGAFPEARAELEAAHTRQGKATAVFLDDIPTQHHLPLLYDGLRRAQEGLGRPAMADSYRIFLEIRSEAESAPLFSDARGRLQENRTVSGPRNRISSSH